MSDYKTTQPASTTTEPYPPSHIQDPSPTYQPSTEPKSSPTDYSSQPPAPAPAHNYASATPLVSLQQAPAPIDCPACGARELTRTQFISGGTTHLAALLFCCVACLGCIPYVAGWFKDVEHHCGRCGVVVAIWHRSGRTEIMPLGQR